MQFFVTFIVLSLIGLTDASYLAYKHRRRQRLVCPIGSDCEAVVESRFSKTLGIRNELLGIAFYLGMLTLAAAVIAFPEHAPLARAGMRIGATLGLGFSAFLTFVQVRIIRQYCFYCLISAGVSALLFVNAFVL